MCTQNIRNLVKRFLRNVGMTEWRYVLKYMYWMYCTCTVHVCTRIHVLDYKVYKQGEHIPQNCYIYVTIPT